MEIELSAEQGLLRETCRDFADRELKPNARRWDREHRYPSEAVKKAFELGLSGVAVPAEWGGAGMDNVAYALAIEEISRGCASVGVTLSVNNSLYCDPLMKYGTDAQKERWLKPFAAGEKLGCFGLTEPQAGSDAAEQRTTAVRRGDKYVINGTKNWITNGPVADAIVLFTMTDLSKALGHAFQYDHEEVWKTLDGIVEKARARDITIAANMGYAYTTHEQMLERVRRLYDHGVRICLMQGADSMFENFSRRLLNDIRSATG